MSLLRHGWVLLLGAALLLATASCVDREGGQDWIGYGAPTDDDDDTGDDDTTAGDDDDTGDDDVGDDDTTDDDDATDDDDTTPSPDDDNDGWTIAEGDCDDTDPQVHPGVPELCDEKDNNCDGQVDEGANNIGCIEYHLDADGDNYGDPATATVCLCGPQPPYSVTNMQDCYDGNADAFPGQPTYFTVSRGDGSFDYDCDNAEAPQWTGTFVCGIGCTSQAGWYTGQPPCGVQAEWGASCYWEWTILDCADTIENRIQACH